MGIFNFLKTKKEENTKDEFVGRHQQFCVVKKFLGEEVPDLELQIAIKKDRSERNEIVKKLEEIEKYIASDVFTNHSDVQSMNEKSRELIDEGYKVCVLVNDSVLEDRCYKIFNDTHEYLKNSVKKLGATESENFSKLYDDSKNLQALGSIVSNSSLGGLLELSTNEHNAWIIMSSLYASNRLTELTLMTFPRVEVEESIRNFAKKLLKENKINEIEFQKINEEIKKGLTTGKEVYK
jgi:hypothetical protein